MNGPIAQFWLERTPDKREVGGSSPPRPTTCQETGYRRQVSGKQAAGRQQKDCHLAPDTWSLDGGVAQLGERLPCTQEVIGSIPFTSTMKLIMNSGF